MYGTWWNSAASHLTRLSSTVTPSEGTDAYWLWRRTSPEICTQLSGCPRSGPGRVGHALVSTANRRRHVLSPGSHCIAHGHLSPDGTVASVATGGLAALGQSDGGFEHHRFATWAAGATGRHPHPGIMRRVLDVLILHPGSLILRSRVIYQFILPRGREGSKFVCIADPILQLLDGNNCAPAIPTFALTFNYGVRGRYG